MSSLTEPHCQRLQCVGRLDQFADSLRLSPFACQREVPDFHFQVSDSRFGLEGYISKFLMCMNIPSAAIRSTMLRKLALMPLSETFTGRHSRTKSRVCIGDLFVGHGGKRVLARLPWPRTNAADIQPANAAGRFFGEVDELAAEFGQRLIVDRPSFHDFQLGKSFRSPGVQTT